MEECLQPVIYVVAYLHNKEALCLASCFQADFQVYVVIVLRIIIIFNHRAKNVSYCIIYSS